MGIQSIDGQSSVCLPSYNAQGAASGTALASPAPVPASATGNPVQQQAGGVQPSQAHIEKAAAQVQDYLKSSGLELTFSVDKASGKTIVKVIDPATQKVIRQLPSKEMLAIAESLGRKSQGLLISQKV